MRRDVTISVGNINLTIKPMRDLRWRCIYYDADNKRRQIAGPFEKVKAKVIKAAKDLDSAGQEPQLTVRESELEEFKVWRASKESGISIGEGIKRFLESQSRKSRRTERTMDEMRKSCERLEEYLGSDSKAKAISIDDLEGWIHQHPKHAAKTRAHRRALTIQIWSWLRDYEYIPYAKHAAEKTAVIDYLPGKREILTPAQIQSVIEKVKPHYLPFVLIGAYAGVRHQEMRPDTRSNKDPLRWEDVNLKEGHIRIRPETSKGRRGRARIIPIQPILDHELRKFLADIPRLGPICPHRPITEGETSRLAKALDLPKWPHNGLRHSYGTYRMAITRDAARVSEEMGNSPSDIRAHYDAVVSESIALDFWQPRTAEAVEFIR